MFARLDLEEHNDEMLAQVARAALPPLWQAHNGKPEVESRHRVASSFSSSVFLEHVS